MKIDAAHILRSRSLKATPARVAVIRLLAREHHPISVAALRSKRAGSTLGEVTMYRTVDALVSAGIAVRVDLGTGESLYELAVGRPHHHHAVCVSCGDMEDVAEADPHALDRRAKSGLTRFATIDSHSLEFFGMCRKCEARA